MPRWTGFVFSFTVVICLPRYLQEGSLQSIDLLAGIDDGSTFSSSQYIYMSIRVHIEDHVVELVDSDDFPSLIDGYVKAQNFIIRARHIGVTTLYVSARQQSGQEILSQPIKVEVYAPPTLHPIFLGYQVLPMCLL